MNDFIKWRDNWFDQNTYLDKTYDKEAYLEALENYTESQLSALNERLKEAEEVVKFYGEKINWSSKCFTVINLKTYALTKILNGCRWENTDEHGGKRARQYLEKYKEK